MFPLNLAISDLRFQGTLLSVSYAYYFAFFHPSSQCLFFLIHCVLRYTLELLDSPMKEVKGKVEVMKEVEVESSCPWPSW